MSSTILESLFHYVDLCVGKTLSRSCGEQREEKQEISSDPEGRDVHEGRSSGQGECGVRGGVSPMKLL